MPLFPWLANVRTLPAPASADRAAVGRAHWEEAAGRMTDPDLGERMAGALADPHGRALLDALFGNSPFLTGCATADPAFTLDLMTHGPGTRFEEILTDLCRQVPVMRDTKAAARRLRQARRQVALTVALADITDTWPLEEVTGALADFADTAVAVALGHLLTVATEAGRFAPPDPAHPVRHSGLIILGMGKLGARELNYSSDIDLIVFYDPEKARWTREDRIQTDTVRLVRDLVKLLEERTVDGYVFRTDLRLRPDPGATPPAVSTEAAFAYYESVGQNWERAAMIKARPVAGDMTAGQEFLKALTAYVWRKYLDFAAIEDIHAIKRQIAAHKGGHHIHIPGHNLKLGRGGIREIEFYAQTQQLIWGGRDRSLRACRTDDALRALARAGRMSEQVAEDLIESYRFLRTVEHRIQMIDDHQTHRLPETREGLAELATFLGHDDVAGLEADLLHHLGRVERHYGRLFEESENLGGAGNLVFTGTEDDPDTLATLAGMGFADPAAMVDTVRNWHRGRYRSTRSNRTRQALTALMPRLLEALSRTANPTFAFRHFDDFLSRLPAGVQLFAMMQARPELLDVLADIMGSAPRLARHLAVHPELLESVLLESDQTTAPPAAQAERLQALLAEAGHFEDRLGLLCRWTNDRQFRIGVEILAGRIQAEEAGGPLSDVADLAVASLQDQVSAAFAERHGHLPGAAMAVLAMGRLGSREMTLRSDLDLIMVYDCPPEVDMSDGRQAKAPSSYFALLSQRLIGALTAATPAGVLYEVDMRLRPSGKAGPIAVSLESFERYQKESAWTWEHMALTRARPITGPTILHGRINAIIREVLTARRDGDKLLADVAEMRRRIAEQHGEDDPWNLKHRAGGLVDIEFLAQYLQLRHAHDHPDILHVNTARALARAARAGVLSGADADTLIDARRLWQRELALMRLSFETAFSSDTASEGVRRRMARAGGVEDFESLCALMDETAAAARAIFDREITEPARRLAPIPERE